ncbi:Uncharacterised protein [Yersinia enterocolitica]|nr:Uncharacterised protein [Yersinia enterocolitica]
MHRRQAAFTVIFKHWEINNPQRCPDIKLSQLQIAPDFQTQCTHRISHDFVAIRAEEENIATFCLSAGQNCL